MRKFIMMLLIGISNTTYSQTITEIDSLTYVMCDYLKTLNDESDTLILNLLFEKHLSPYLDQVDSSNLEKVRDQIFFRFQRNCIEFHNLLDRLSPPKEAAKQKMEKPKPTISNKQLQEFKNQRVFYYLEASGDTTLVLMDGGVWSDSFPDGTFSKLTYNWINETEFELVFIESNNVSRSNYSIKGDKYFYQVLSKKSSFYLMTVNVPGQNVFEVFKMYYK